MKNNDTILKYLSGLLDEKEKSDFEKELTENPELKNEYDRISKNLDDLKITPVIDNAYFANLEQKVKSKSTGKSKTHSFGFSLGIGAVFSILFIIAIYNFIFDKSGNKRYIDKNTPTIVLSSNDLADSYSIDDLENIGITADDYFSAGFSELSENDLISFLSDTDFGDISDDLFTDVSTIDNFTEMINELKNIKY